MLENLILSFCMNDDFQTDYENFCDHNVPDT
jgi:hypothetical protein